ncbi:hypothetical protein Tco_0275047, partial [Tanacetum coccineum]
SRWLVASWSSSRGKGCRGDDDDGGDGVAVVYDDGVVAAVVKNDGGGAWYSGSVRSGEEEYLWCWPENSLENYSGGRKWWPAAGRTWEEGERETKGSVCIFL